MPPALKVVGGGKWAGHPRLSPEGESQEPLARGVKIKGMPHKVRRSHRAFVSVRIDRTCGISQRKGSSGRFFIRRPEITPSHPALRS